MAKKPAPTDLEILDAVYERYYDTFIDFTEGQSTSRESKMYVPIDCAQIATDLNVDPDLVFGRLYYDLQYRYGYRQDDGASVPFFTLAVGQRDRHCVSFPRLSAVLSTLRAEEKQRSWSTAIAVLSLVIAVASAAVSLLN